MRKNLLEFLYGDAVIRESSQNLGEQVVKLFEEAADEEAEEMVASKEPLVAALKSVGIDKSVEAVAQGCVLTCDDATEYRKYVRLLSDPENMHTLASKGWVPAKCGDVAMSFEPGEFKINFIEIATAETNDKDKVPDLEKVMKDAQKFASTEPEHDDLNPVEYDKKGSKDGQKGVGDPKDGEDPEGKPKGVKKTTESAEDDDERYYYARVGGQRVRKPVPPMCPKCKKYKPCKCDKSAKPHVQKSLDGKPVYGPHYRHKRPGTAAPPTRMESSAKQVAESLLEMTSTGSMGTVDGPPMGASGINWKERLKALRKRRGEKPDDDEGM